MSFSKCLLLLPLPISFVLSSRILAKVYQLHIPKFSKKMNVFFITAKYIYSLVYTKTKNSLFFFVCFFNIIFVTKYKIIMKQIKKQERFFLFSFLLYLFIFILVKNKKKDLQKNTKINK